MDPDPKRTAAEEGSQLQPPEAEEEVDPRIQVSGVSDRPTRDPWESGSRGAIAAESGWGDRIGARAGLYLQSKQACVCVCVRV